MCDVTRGLVKVDSDSSAETNCQQDGFQVLIERRQSIQRRRKEHAVEHQGSTWLFALLVITAITQRPHLASETIHSIDGRRAS
jgi:hypothetical protein